VVVVKELKRVKKPGASRPETRLGLEVSTLAVDSPLLHGLWWAHGRVECDDFCLACRGRRLADLKVASQLARALSLQPTKAVSCPRCLAYRG